MDTMNTPRRSENRPSFRVVSPVCRLHVVRVDPVGGRPLITTSCAFATLQDSSRFGRHPIYIAVLACVYRASNLVGCRHGFGVEIQTSGEARAFVHILAASHEVRKNAAVAQAQIAPLVSMSRSGNRRWEQGTRRAGMRLPAAIRKDTALSSDLPFESSCSRPAKPVNSPQTW